jgi:hypothetical protein
LGSPSALTSKAASDELFGRSFGDCEARWIARSNAAPSDERHAQAA